MRPGPGLRRRRNCSQGAFSHGPGEVTVQAKICGVSTPAALAAAVGSGATHVGFVHHPASPRHLPLADLATLRERVPAGVASVAVVVDPSDALLADLRSIAPDILQLHRVTPGRAAAVRARWAGGLWVGLAVRSSADLDRATAFAPHADRLLLDAPTDPLEVPGGTGRSFDWSLLEGRLPYPWILSGGLTPRNVAGAVAATGADFVDVSSGVERAPGVKDVDKITAFLTACRP